MATASALLVEVVRLRVVVLTALREAETSRARLQRAGYQERERLERDLHDGAQQRLVSLGMAIRLAQRHLNDGTVDVDGLLDQIRRGDSLPRSRNSAGSRTVYGRAVWTTDSDPR